MNPFAGQRNTKATSNNHANDQAKLVLLASLPCLALADIALYLLGTSVYLIAFLNIVLLLLIVYAASAGKQRANYQIQTLTNLIEAMIDGDYSLRGRQQSHPYFQDLLNLVNQLADNLQHHKLKAEENQLLLEKIMDQMDAMVFAVDPRRHLVMINGTAKKLLLGTEETTEPLTLDDLNLGSLESMQNSGVIDVNNQKIRGEFFLIKDQFISGNVRHDLYLITRADRLLREKEREAWQNLLRVLSHELNNSLTPIATFSRTMLKRLDGDNAEEKITSFREGLSVIKERAESLHAFIASYSQLSHLPPPKLAECRWLDTLDKAAALVGGESVVNSIDSERFDRHTVHADAGQLEQVFINLIKNAKESHDSGTPIFVGLSAQTERNYLMISISDKGRGIANPENLFVPFYTTKPSGSGIGLNLCRQILMNHNGFLELKNRLDGRGALATISLPIPATGKE